MLQKTRILIVDDEDNVRLCLMRALAGKHCHVEVAANGRDALDRMEQGPFDLVLLDIRMPGEDGMTVLRAIRRNWPDSEVIATTRFPLIESAKEAVSLGAYDYLAKPVGPGEIINAANRALQHKRWALRPMPPARLEAGRHSFTQ